MKRGRVLNSPPVWRFPLFCFFISRDRKTTTSVSLRFKNTKWIILWRSHYTHKITYFSMELNFWVQLWIFIHINPLLLRWTLLNANHFSSPVTMYWKTVSKDNTFFSTIGFPKHKLLNKQTNIYLNSHTCICRCTTLFRNGGVMRRGSNWGMREPVMETGLK